MLSTFCCCEKRVIDPQSTRRATEAAAVETLKSKAVQLTEWAKERRPQRKWPPNVAVEWKFVTNLEMRLSSLADKNLPDDLEEALDGYIRTFKKHPDLVERKVGPRDLSIFGTYGRELKAFAAEIRPVGEHLRAVAEQHGANLDDLVEEW